MADPNDEMRRKIDARFDQFSLDETRNAIDGALTLAITFPGLSVREHEFADTYFNHKMRELRERLRKDGLATKGE